MFCFAEEKLPEISVKRIQLLAWRESAGFENFEAEKRMAQYSIDRVGDLSCFGRSLGNQMYIFYNENNKVCFISYANRRNPESDVYQVALLEIGDEKYLTLLEQNPGENSLKVAVFLWDGNVTNHSKEKYSKISFKTICRAIYPVKGFPAKTQLPVKGAKPVSEISLRLNSRSPNPLKFKVKGIQTHSTGQSFIGLEVVQVIGDEEKSVMVFYPETKQWDIRR